MTGKEKRQKFWKAVHLELTENKNTFLVYSGMRVVVIVMMILQFFNRNYENVFLCLLTLVLMIMPSILQVTFKVEFPSVLEIIILFFIFAAEILGEIQSFYIHFPYWDTILHTLNGFLCAAIGFSLVELLNRHKRLHFNLSPLFLAIVAFSFSMTIGVLWEFFEYGMDTFFKMDMQKDTVIHTISSTYLDPTKQNLRVVISGIEEVMINGQPLGVGGYLDIGLIDTMMDLLVNFVGAIIFAILGYFYMKHQNKSVIMNLVPTPQEDHKYEKLEEAERKKQEEQER
ncbi:MAG: hypothetical protein PUI46_00670 [Lachnospiraceae bacterium]|nr:hypothetical protein [Lachnospiraceae bacterium]MDY5701192.1 hypothetical protein [Lachnospiraceae bacterium]